MSSDPIQLSPEAYDDLMHMAKTCKTMFENKGKLSKVMWVKLWEGDLQKPRVAGNFLVVLLTKLHGIQIGKERLTHTELTEMVSRLARGLLYRKVDGSADDSYRSDISKEDRAVMNLIVMTLYFVTMYYEFDTKSALLEAIVKRLVRHSQKATKAQMTADLMFMFTEEIVRMLQVESYLSTIAFKFLIQQSFNITNTFYGELSDVTLTVEYTSAFLGPFLREFLTMRAYAKDIFSIMLECFNYVSLDDEMLVHLMLMFKTYIMSCPFVPRNVLEKSAQVMKKLYLWPMPYCYLARDVLNVLEIERRAPGAGIRKQLKAEMPQIHRGKPDEPRERVIHLIVDRDCPGAVDVQAVLESYKTRRRVVTTNELYRGIITSVLMNCLDMEGDAVGLHLVSDESIPKLYGQLIEIMNTSACMPEHSEATAFRTEKLKAFHVLIRSEMSVGASPKRVDPPRLPPLEFAITEITSRHEITKTNTFGSKCYFPEREEVMSVLEVILAEHKRIKQDKRRTTVRIGVIGNDKTIHLITSAYFGLIMSLRELFKGIDIQFYLIPPSKCNMARFLASCDRWYSRNVCSLTQGVLSLLPSIDNEEPKSSVKITPNAPEQRTTRQKVKEKFFGVKPKNKEDKASKNEGESQEKQKERSQSSLPAPENFLSELKDKLPDQSGAPLIAPSLQRQLELDQERKIGKSGHVRQNSKKSVRYSSHELYFLQGDNNGRGHPTSNYTPTIPSRPKVAGTPKPTKKARRPARKPPTPASAKPRMRTASNLTRRPPKRDLTVDPETLFAQGTGVSPSTFFHMELENFFRFARYPCRTMIYHCRCWQEGKGKSIMIPFCQRVEVGYAVYKARTKKSDNEANSKFNPAILNIKLSEMNVYEVNRGTRQLQKRPYKRVVLRSVNWKGDTGVGSHPSRRWLEMYLEESTKKSRKAKLRRTDGQCLILRVASAQEAQQWCVSLQTHTFQYTTIRLADFDWITAIGKGASGKVFLVRDNRTNARLALKVIDKTRVFRTHLTFQHVINERLVLEMCSGCPFLIQLRYAFQTDSHLYFATDFYDGGDVFSLLQSNRGKLSEHHARRIIAEIVLALSWLHERNIVYRDLKPENVVLDGDGHVRLADFGLAKVLKPDQDYLTQTICGTTAYAAPEMLQSKPYNVSLDLWCLGIFTYHVLTGRTPFNFKGRTMEEMEEMQRTRQIRYPSSLSLEAVSLIQGLLQNDPLSRSTLEDVKRHPFFRGVDWFRVAQKEPHPDDISRFVSDEEQRGSVIARLAVARAQQLGMQSESASALARTDLQDISSMTLDRYLLRNVNPEEWRHVSFSDDDDMSATAEFPAFVHKKGTEMETWAIAGWAWTCSEASGHTAPIEGGRQAFMGEGHGFYSHTSIHGRRSLPSWNHSGTEEQAYTGQLSNETGRQVLAQNRASLQEQPVTNGALAQAEERTVRPSADSSLHRVDAGVTTSDLPDRAGVDIRNGSQSPRIQAFGAPPAEATKRTSSRGMLNFGRIGSTVRARVSADSASRARRSVERISKEVRARGNASISVPSAARPPTSKKHGRSSIDFILGQHANS